jgi:iron-sulfur cluster assembly accessory protein
MSESVTVTERAAKRIAEIVAGEAAARALRISVDLVPDAAADDVVLERAGAKVVIDQISLGFLAGSEIDFVDDLIGASFRVNNPKATASCGCGTSFSI